LRFAARYFGTPLEVELCIMVTYVLTQRADDWLLHRYHEQSVTRIAASILTEGEAMELALCHAEADKPAQVIRISRSGESQVIARILVE
jgi:hypothetical protein